MQVKCSPLQLSAGRKLTSFFHYIERRIMANTPASPVGSLPATGFVRQAQLIPRIIPVSSATWWRWVKAGKAPRPIKLSERVTAWRAEDIRTFLESMAPATAE